MRVSTACSISRGSLGSVRASGATAAGSMLGWLMCSMLCTSVIGFG